MQAGQKQVKDIMTRDLITVGPQDKLHDALELMTVHRIRHLPVTEGAGKHVGVISSRDIYRATQGGADGKPTDAIYKMRVEEVMVRSLRTIGSGASAGDASRLMLDANVSCLLVVENEKLVGIVTSRDLLRAVSELLDSGEA